MCVFVSQGTSLLVEKAVKIGSSNYHFVTTDLVVIKMGKSAFDKVVHACFGKVAHPNYMDTITKFENGWFEMYREFDIPYINKGCSFNQKRLWKLLIRNLIFSGKDTR